MEYSRIYISLKGLSYDYAILHAVSTDLFSFVMPALSGGTWLHHNPNGNDKLWGENADILVGMVEYTWVIECTSPVESLTYDIFKSHSTKC